MATVYHYPVWVRVWHAINALLFLMLIITGISMHYSNQEFNLIGFNTAVSVHNVCGILLSANYIIFIIYNRFTTNGNHYRITTTGLLSSNIRQFKYYIRGIFTGQKPPYPVNESRKFNPLQTLSYVVVMYFLMFLIIISGWALIFPEVVFVKQLFGTSGIHLTAVLHIVVGYILSLFLFVHVYLCIIPKPFCSSLRAMISGWHSAEQV
jgi:thiosulfate reductase cytochrome b subunit